MRLARYCRAAEVRLLAASVLREARLGGPRRPTRGGRRQARHSVTSITSTAAGLVQTPPAVGRATPVGPPSPGRACRPTCRGRGCYAARARKPAGESEALGATRLKRTSGHGRVSAGRCSSEHVLHAARHVGLAIRRQVAASGQLGSAAGLYRKRVRN
jgi:hypothetical protein